MITKNVHIIKTDEPSRLHITGKLSLYPNGILVKSQGLCKNQHVYITVDDTIKIGDREIIDNECRKLKFTKETRIGKKVILSDDPKLVKDGIQEIPNAFLEFLVQNPSCESVEFEKEHDDTVPYPKMRYVEPYKIILPKEEPKQTDEKGKPLTYWGGLKEIKSHSFCETPEEKCTMNYCDENGCQNRKRQLTDLEIAIRLEEIEREEPTQETIEGAAENHQKGGYEWQNEKRKSFTAGAKSDAAREMWHKKFKHESINALKAIENLCDSQNPTHEDIWRIAYGVINDLTGKE
jgi:hypothetical protein